MNRCTRPATSTIYLYAMVDGLAEIEDIFSLEGFVLVLFILVVCTFAGCIPALCFELAHLTTQSTFIS